MEFGQLVMMTTKQTRQPPKRNYKGSQEPRRWDNLPPSCLVNVFRRVGMCSLVLDVPFVCKSWYDASSDPHCWNNLNFPDFGRPQDLYFSPSAPLVTTYAWRLFFTYKLCYKGAYDEFVESVVDKSGGAATSLNLPGNCRPDTLVYISQRCPNLKSICLRSDFLSKYGRVFADLIVKWKDLEVLGVGGSGFLGEILTQIGLHCTNFRSLSCSNCDIGPEEATAIVRFPRLKYLRISDSRMAREVVMTILLECEELELMELTKCVGFVEDAEIYRLGSGIRYFKCEDCNLFQETDHDDHDQHNEDNNHNIHHYIP